MIKRGLFFVFLIFHQCMQAGGNLGNAFQYYTTDDGLSHNMVDCMLKDSRGYMWFGTWDGLNRFDGYDFKIFRTLADSSENTISGNFIYSLVEDGNGNIWIGNNHGIDIYSYLEDRIVNLNIKLDTTAFSRIFNMVIDDNNLIWVGTEYNVYKLTINDKPGVSKVEKVSVDLIQSDVQPAKINVIYKDTDKNIWIGTNHGLLKIDKVTGAQKIYQFEPGNPNSLVNNEIKSIYLDQTGILWIGTQIGISKLNLKTETFENHTLYQSPDAFFPHDDVTCFVEDHQGNLVIGSLGGLSVYNLNTGHFKFIRDVQFSKFGLNNSFVNCLLSDSEGNIWVGTERGGINKYNAIQSGFQAIIHIPTDPNSLNTKIVNSVYEDSQYIWIGTAGGGINRYDKKNDSFRYYTNNRYDPKSVPNNFISAIFRDRIGQMWFATWGNGIGILTEDHVEDGKFYVLSNLLSNTGLSSDFISSFAEDNLGRVWVSTLDGIDCIDPVSFRNRSFTSTADGEKIKEVGCLLFDDQNNLWIGTRDGVFKAFADKNGVVDPDLCQVIRIENKPDVVTSISGNYAISMIMDRIGNIWIGTYGGGLNRLSKKNNHENKFEFDRYDMENNLCNNIIYRIEEDHNGYLWLSTDNGLSRMSPSNGQFRNYSLSDGLMSNQFYWASSFKNNEGRIYFGCMNGLVLFNPSDFYDNAITMHVHLTDFKVNNRSVKVGQSYFGRTLLSNNVTETRSISLPPQVSEFSFEFSALQFTQPERYYYAYKLEPYDKEWILTDYKNRKATYMNMAPGKYKLYIKVSNNDMVFDNPATEMDIEVIAPFYKTIWFLLLMIGLSIFVIMSIIRYRTINLRKRNERLEDLVHIRTKQIEEQKEELQIQTEYLKENNALLEERQELIEIQKDELEIHRNRLEDLVMERTAELEKAKSRAEESDRLKTAFLANMSHEIRTPMNAIVGFSSLLNDFDLTNDERANLIAMINSSSESLLHLIDDILDLSMIESDQLTINLEFISLNSLLDNVYSAMLLINRNPDLQIRINNELKDEHLEINTDIYRIKQVLINLMNNALKFTDRGFVELGVRKLSDRLSFYVRDTGRGISPEELEVIFERFRKIEDDKNRLYRGAGLGLSISRRLSEMLGGKMHVESNKDIGSTFYFELPLNYLRSIQMEPSTHNDTSKVNLSDELILIVEDEYSNYYLIEKALSQKNIQSLWAKDGMEAITMVQSYPNIALVLMDINMPKVGGLAAYKKIRDINDKIIIIAQTAFARYEDETRIRATGFDDFIGKPIQIKELFGVIERHLKVRNN